MTDEELFALVAGWFVDHPGLVAARLFRWGSRRFLAAETPVFDPDVVDLLSDLDRELCQGGEDFGSVASPIAGREAIIDFLVFAFELDSREGIEQVWMLARAE